jgi:hypothetical protein
LEFNSEDAKLRVCLDLFNILIMKIAVTVFLFFAFINSIDAQTISEDIVDGDSVFVSYKEGRTDSIYVTDTFVFASFLMRNYIVGSQKLNGTINQLSLWEYDLYLNKVGFGQCRKTNVTHYESANYFKDSIIDITKTDSSLTVNVAASQNCCHSFLFDASVNSDDILNLIYIGYGSRCACNCGVCFSYEFSFPYNGMAPEDIVEIKGIMLNGNSKTLIKLKEE